MDITLRQIRAFIAVARIGSFTQAAGALNLTQPALTVQIRRLEEALNLRLFDRTTRTVELNQIGADILPVFERMMQDLAGVIDETRDVVAIKRGIIRIAALPSVAASVLPRAIDGFRKSFPGASFIVHDVVAQEVVARVRDATVDIGITGGDKLPPDLELVHGLHEPFQVIAPKGHELAKRKMVGRDEILRYPLVALHPSTSVRRVVDGWLEQVAQPPVIACEATYMMTVAGMVSAGLGIALLPVSSREFIAFPDLCAISIAPPAPLRKVSIVTLGGRSLSPMSERFCEVLVSELSIQ